MTWPFIYPETHAHWACLRIRAIFHLHSESGAANDRRSAMRSLWHRALSLECNHLCVSHDHRRQAGTQCNAPGAMRLPVILQSEYLSLSTSPSNSSCTNTPPWRSSTRCTRCFCPTLFQPAGISFLVSCDAGEGKRVRIRHSRTRDVVSIIRVGVIKTTKCQPATTKTRK